MTHDQRTRIAFHEAGHAVACALLGLPFHAVTAGEDHGDVDMPAEPSPTRRDARKRVDVSVAGAAAEWVLIGRPVPLAGKWDGDLDHALWMGGYAEPHLGRRALRSYLVRRRAAVRDLLRTHWSAVSGVATSLLELGTVDASKVRTAVRASKRQRGRSAPTT